MKKKIIATAILLALPITFAVCNTKSVPQNVKGKLGANLAAVKATNENDAVTSANEENKSDATKSDDLAKDTNKSANIKSEDLTSSKMNDLLSKLQGDWYNFSNEAEIRTEGPRELIKVYKEGADYKIVRVFLDTALWGKVKAIKQLNNKGNYSLAAYNDRDKGNMEFILNISDDFKSMNVTSQYDKNSKYVKATKEVIQYAQMLYLSGTYRDDNNKEYVFKDGGIAVWPGNTFKFSIAYIEKPSQSSDSSKVVNKYIVVNDSSGKETMRYFYDIIGNKLNLYKTVIGQQNNYNKGELVVSLTKINGTTDLNQKAIDIVAKKYNAVASYRGEDGFVYYKSDLGKISFDCTGPYEKDKYKVSIFDKTSNIFKNFSVNIITEKVEELK